MKDLLPRMKTHIGKKVLSIRVIVLTILSAILLTGFTSCTHNATQTQQRVFAKNTGVYFPSRDLHELYANVELSGIFPDSKTFADCTPLSPPDSVLKWYREQKSRPAFDLKTFVSQHFDIPKSNPEINRNNWNKNIIGHLNNMWNALERKPDSVKAYSTLLPLSYPYIVPGGRFREIYYWDSYFTMAGLVVSGRLTMVRDMLNNFNDLIKRYGFIPNGNRSYYLSRSQPPFFAEMVKLYMHAKGDTAGLRYLPSLREEYDFWMSCGNKTTSQHVVKIHDLVLNRYWDKLAEPRTESYREDVRLAQKVPKENRKQLYHNLRSACESGWDFSSRWLANPDSLTSIHTTDILPVDLNCLLYNLESTLSELYALNDQLQECAEFKKKAARRKKAINAFFWNEKKGFYFDYDLRNDRQTSIISLAAVYPLFFRVADTEQAHLVAYKLRDKLLKPGGLVTTTNHTGQQWDAPNGWAPLQWLAVRGLENYGEKKLAKEIATRWMTLNKKVYEKTGKMMEKYNVEDLSLTAGGGEYPTQDGFGWTNGVYLGLWKRYEYKQ